MVKINLFSYKLKKNISFGESQGENKVYLFDKRNRNVKFAISNYDENLVAFFAALIDGDIYDLDRASKEYKVNHRIIDLLIEKKLIKKKFRIIVNLPYLGNLKIKGYRKFLNNAYLPLFIIGWVSLIEVNLNFFSLSIYSIIIAITTSVLFHEISHILCINECNNMFIVDNVFLSIFPLTVGVSFKSIDVDFDLSDYIDIISGGVKLQLVYFGICNSAAFILSYFEYLELCEVLTNIGIIDLAIAIINMIYFESDLSTDGCQIVNEIFYRYNKGKSLILEIISLLTKYSLISMVLLFLYLFFAGRIYL